MADQVEVEFQLSKSHEDEKSTLFWYGALSYITNNLPFSWKVQIHWGKFGTVGTNTEKFFARRPAALAYLQARQRDKLKKGYVEGGWTALKPPLIASPVGPAKSVTTNWDLY